jgi:hypothetical protein
MKKRQYGFVESQEFMEKFKGLPDVSDAFAGADSAYFGDDNLLPWKVVCTRNKCSDNLVNSNFDVFLQELGGENQDRGVAIIRANHWAAGWVDYLCIKPSHKAKAILCGFLLSSLENYPILDDDDFSMREYEDEMIARNAYLNDHKCHDKYGLIRPEEDVIKIYLRKWFETETALLREQAYEDKVKYFLSEEFADELYDLMEYPDKYFDAYMEEQTLNERIFRTMIKDLYSVIKMENEAKAGQLELALEGRSD